MSGISPASVLYSSDGTELTVVQNTSIPSNTRAILSAGSDGTNARPLLVDSSGRAVVVGAGTAGTPVGGVLTIQGIGSGTAVTISGTVTANAGTGNFTNASVSTTGSAIPASATFIGASVTTSAPTYSNGNLGALSLTTAGLLRVDGSGVTQPVSGTVTSNIGTTGGLALDATLTGGTMTTRITDGTNTATVKAASTAAVATDKALVVAISPNNSFSTSTNDVTSSGALGSLNATVAVVLQGLNSVGFQLSAGTLVGTIVAELSYDGGTTWFTSYFDQASGQKVSSVVYGSSNTALSSTIVGAGGASNARVRVSAYTSGTANIAVRASSINDPSVMFAGPAASTLPFTIAQTGGSVTTSAPTYSNGTLNALSLTTAGLLRTDGSGTTQPVSGTVSATQSGTWTVQPGNTANTTPWLTTISQGGNSATVTAGNALKIDGSAVTQPVSGTITANIGTSGSLALDATLAKLTITQSTALGSNTQAMVGGSVTTTAPTYTTGNINPLSLTTAGALRIDGSGSTQPVSGTITANIGTSGSLALDASVTAQYLVDNAGFTDGTSKVTPVGYIFDEVAGTALTENDVGAARMDSKRALVVTLEDTTARGTRLAITAAGSGSSTGVITIQGNASGTPVPVSGTVTATNASVSTTGTSPPASATYMGASVTTSAPSYTTGQMSALSLTTTGLLRVDGSGVTQPVSGTVTANIGSSGSLALDASVTAQYLVDNAGFTDGTSKVTPIGFIFDEVAGTALTENDVGAARMDSKRALVNVIEDGTTRGTRATVKAASTAAVAGDTALVVAISPNNTLSVLSDKSATATATNVAASVTNVTLLASNANRILATFYNDSSSKVYVKLGTTASTSSFTILILPNSYWELPLSYTGNIDAIWTSASGSMRCCECT